MFRLMRLVTLPLLVASVVLTACGGDSSPSSKDESFCREIEQLDSLDIQNDIGTAAEILTGLAKKAPNDDVRKALELIAPIFEQLDAVDQNDAAAMQTIFELMSSPEVTAASDVLDRYGSEVCGFDNGGSDTTAP